MFASQLLRILQTFPTHVNYEVCAFDTDELTATMKESPGRYADPLSSEVNDKDKFWNTPELEHSMVVDNFADNNEDENFRKSFAPCTVVPSEFFEKDTDFYTDKNVMECELPELIACYKESAYHVIEDNCIDEGIPSEDKILIDNDKNNHEVLVEDSLRSSSGEDCYVHAAIECETEEKMDIDLLIPEDHSDMSKLNIDTEIPNQDGLKSSSGNCEDAVTKECGTKGKVDIDLLDLDEIKHVSKDDSDDDDASSESGPDGLKLSVESNTVHEANDCGPVDLMQRDEKDSNATDDLMEDASTEQLISSSMISVQDNHPQTSLKFLLESSDNGVDDVKHQLGQMPIEKIPENPAVVSEAEELSRSCETNNISYDSKVERGTISFNFDSNEVATIAGRVQDFPIQSRDVPVGSHDDTTSESFSTTSQVQSSEGDPSPEHVNDFLIQSQNLPIHDNKRSESFLMASQVQCGEGESSFSAMGSVSGLNTYSGPIAFSGSISLRSDSSTTSTRSFAFPILQSEWNSSPVKMAKADRRHFLKHRGWRHGLLCCRF